MNLMVLTNEEVSLIRVARRHYFNDKQSRLAVKWLGKNFRDSDYVQLIRNGFDKPTNSIIMKDIHEEHVLALQALGGYGKWYREHIKPMEDKKVLWNMLSCVPAKVITREQAVKLYDTK